MLKTVLAMRQAQRLVWSDWRDRDQQVRVLGAGGPERGWARGVAGHGAQVEALLQHAQARRVGIDHGDIVGLGDEVLGRGRPDLAGAQDDDFHAK
jgi:hypothetical protein